MAIHPNWKRETLTFEVTETAVGWGLTLIGESKHWEQPLEVLFATEEHATKAGQAILDYAYGPAKTINWSKAEKSDEEPKPKTRKAPGKRGKANRP